MCRRARCRLLMQPARDCGNNSTVKLIHKRVDSHEPKIWSSLASGKVRSSRKGAGRRYPGATLTPEMCY